MTSWSFTPDSSEERVNSPRLIFEVLGIPAWKGPFMGNLGWMDAHDLDMTIVASCFSAPEDVC